MAAKLARNKGAILGAALLGLLFAQEGRAGQSAGMVRIPEGSYVPFFLQSLPAKPGAPASAPSRAPVRISAFWMDRTPVTQGEYVRFLRLHPEWRKSRIAPLFSDEHYLQSWKGDLQPAGSLLAPVVGVSWFAAHAYCDAQGKELPTIDQWEYVADDHGHGRKAAAPVIFAWYAKPGAESLPIVGKNRSHNSYGVDDLHGLIWEWALDFNSAMVTEEARDGGTRDSNLFCGNGAQGALDPADYASFMRYSFRNSLKASYATGNLGFRCVREGK